MTAVRAFVALLMLLALGLLSACGGGGGGGGGGTTPEITANPAITGLNTAQAVAGQTILISGTSFGTSQGTSTLRLNGLPFVVQSWTDTQIEATVPEGAASGTVLVTVDSRTSDGGNAAYLEIITETMPKPASVTPAHGRPGDSVSLTGGDFGTETLDVVFINSARTEFPATVTDWSDFLATVTVPDLPPGAYTIAMVSGDWRSTEIIFTCDAESTPDGPAITSVTPGSGAVSSIIEITGSGFGADGTAGELKLGELGMATSEWSDTRIKAWVPFEAVSAKITITVDGLQAVWPAADGELFIVNGLPEITAFNPEEVIIGQSLEILGYNFQDTPGTVTIGGTEQPITDWEPYGDEGLCRITIPTVKSFADDPSWETSGGAYITDENGVPVDFFLIQVTTQDMIVNNRKLIAKGTALSGTVTVDPPYGQFSEFELLDGTNFYFYVDVSGGSGNYYMKVIPDRNNPQARCGESFPGNPPYVTYIYPYSPTSPDQTSFETMIWIRDYETKDYTTIPGPEVTLVKYGLPVIESLAVSDFNNGGVPAPNEICHDPLSESYGGFSIGEEIYFTSARCPVTEGETILDHYTRDLAASTIDGGNPLPLGYRYFSDNGDDTDDGAIISIRGFNFGDEPGLVVLNTSGTGCNADTFVATDDVPTGWTDSEIRFQLPGSMLHLSGSVRVIPAEFVASEPQYPYADGPLPLTCSPYIVNVAPLEDAVLETDTLTVTGFDLRPPHVANRVGGGIYSIWNVPVAYTDPWTDTAMTGRGRLVNPVPSSYTDATAVQFVLADLDADADGSVLVEVVNADGSDSAIVEARLVDGDYSFFLWTGVLEEGTPEAIANSGVFSEMCTLERVSPRPNIGPTAVCTVTPAEGTVPLQVTIDGSSSTDSDGTIVNYEWDFDGDGYFNEAGDEAAAGGSAGPHGYLYSQAGYYTIRLRVTDDDGASHTGTCGVEVTGGIAANSLTVSLTIEIDEGFSGIDQTLVRLYRGDPNDGGTPINQYAVSHVDDVPNSCTFEDLPDGSNYFVRLMNTCIIWEGDTAGIPIKDYGPYEVPPDQHLEIFGTQYIDPPAPG